MMKNCKRLSYLNCWKTRSLSVSPSLWQLVIWRTVESGHMKLLLVILHIIIIRLNFSLSIEVHLQHKFLNVKIHIYY